MLTNESKKLSLNDITVLGLVAESSVPINGQSLEKVIEVRGMRAWTKIGKSSVYHALNKLKNLKLLQAERHVTEGKGTTPPVTKTFYEITEEGKYQLRQAIIAIITEMRKVIYPFDIALANSPLLTKEELIEALENRVKTIEKRQQVLSERLNYFRQPDATAFNIEGLPTRENLLIVQALFSKPLELLSCEKRWIIGFIEEFKNKK